MRSRNALRTGLLVVGTIALLGACASDSEPPASSSGTPEPSSAAPSVAGGGNGQLFTTQEGDTETTLRRYPIAADGSVGEAVVVVKGPSTSTSFPGIVDSLGQTMLTGTYEDYWTTSLQRRDLLGKEVGNLTVDRWCGGEGTAANLCKLLDDTNLARTTELSDETAEGSVLVSDLANGSTADTWGPFPGLNRMLGTTQPNVVLLSTTTGKPTDDNPNVPGTIIRLDTATGKTSDVADYPQDWNALCAVGADGVIGYTLGTNPTIVGVGQVTLGKVTVTEDDAMLGCSADGAFLYIQNIPQPPEGDNDEEPANPATALERINLATGARDTIATLPPGEWAGRVTR